MKKAEISVLEFNYHAEVLRDFCKITANTDFRINIFTTENIWRKVAGDELTLPDNLHLFLKKEPLPIAEFVHANCNKLNNSDIIIFNTVASNFNFFFNLELKPATIVRIHNTNACFNKLINAYTPRFTPFFIWKDLSHFVRKTIGERESYYKIKFLKKTHYYAFPNNLILNHAVDNYNIPKAKAIVLPLSFMPDKKTIQEIQENIPTTIAVVGRIDQRIRDYRGLYNAFKIVLQKNIKPIRLILLGSSNSVYKRKIVKLFKSLESDKFTLTSFENFVEQSVFYHYINLSHFLILPIKINTRHTIYNEKYGYTKMSGNINDIIKYKKPALVYSGYPLDEDLKLITAPFKGESDLAEKILDWSENEKYNSMDFDIVLENHNLNTVREQFEKTIDKILLKTKK